MNPHVLMLPGNMCDDRLWKPLADLLASEGIGVRVGSLSDQCTIEEMALAMLTKHHGPLIPVGFSMGAIVALEMARQARSRIAALGLIALNAGADLPERSAARPRQQAAVRDGELERIVAQELKPNYLAEARRDDTALRKLLMDMAIALGPDVFVRQSEALRTRRDLKPLLPTLRMPVLLACGAEDALCPPDWHQQWARMIGRSAILKVIDGAGHMVPLEQPQLLADSIIPWLSLNLVRECPTLS